jgi:hypothetical protein
MPGESTPAAPQARRPIGVHERSSTEQSAGSNELEPVAVVAHALGMARQNAQRKFSNLPEPNR